MIDVENSLSKVLYEKYFENLSEIYKENGFNIDRILSAPACLRAVAFVKTIGEYYE